MKRAKRDQFTYQMHTNQEHGYSGVEICQVYRELEVNVPNGPQIIIPAPLSPDYKHDILMFHFANVTVGANCGFYLTDGTSKYSFWSQAIKYTFAQTYRYDTAPLKQMNALTDWCIDDNSLGAYGVIDVCIQYAVVYSRL